MTDKNNFAVLDFLKKNGLSLAKRLPLAGDASNRRYERITYNTKTYMLMVAPPDKEDVRPFIKVAEILQKANLHAPQILSQDIENGLLLLEDMGDDLYSRVLLTSNNEIELYKSAVEVLDNLPQSVELPEYSEAKLLEETLLFIDWYATSASKDEFIQLWRKYLNLLDNTKKVLVLRDYHADNLIWLPKEHGLRRVGLLDFQDAVIGHPAYDLVSLLEDARRDVRPDTVTKILSGKNMDFMRDYFILGAQRNLKIIGIFNRLKKRDGKDNYLKFLPRVWNHLRHDLEHPALAELKEWLLVNCYTDVLP